MTDKTKPTQSGAQALTNAAEQFCAAYKDGNAADLLDYFYNIFSDALREIGDGHIDCIHGREKPMRWETVSDRHEVLVDGDELIVAELHENKEVGWDAWTSGLGGKHYFTKDAARGWIQREIPMNIRALGGK